MFHRKLQLATSANLCSSIDSVVEWCVTVTFGSQLLALIVVSVVVTIVAKLLGVIRELIRSEGLGSDTMETDSLRPVKTATVNCNYGTISEEETAKSDFSGGSGKMMNEKAVSSEDLYDGKLCVICFEEERDCFFVPCGHCASCIICAQRILYGESKKSCPVCRRLIGKVKRLPV